MTASEFLSRFAARHPPIDAQRERLRAAARRFAAMVAAGPAPEETVAEQQLATLVIESGLHCGASVELAAAQYLIGPGEDCDVVLRDPGMAKRQYRLLREAAGFSLRDVHGPDSQPLAPQTVRRKDEATESVYDLAGVRVAVIQPAPQAGSPAQHPVPQRSVLWFLSHALLVGLAVTAIAFAIAHRLVDQMTPDIAERVVKGSADLVAQGFQAVRFRRGPQGELEVAGLVADAAEQERLRKWLARANYGDARFSVQQAAGLIEQVRDALGAKDLRVDFAGGRLRIEGTTRQLPIKTRIRMLAAELQGVVDIDDRVAYVEGPESPKGPGPLPVRIRDVMIGNPSYFRTDTGARYFEGALLPDGAEVLSIEPQRIRFRLAQKVIVYDLD